MTVSVLCFRALGTYLRLSKLNNACSDLLWVLVGVGANVAFERSIMRGRLQEGKAARKISVPMYYHTL